MISQDTAARLGLAQGVTAGQAGVNTARGANDVALGNSLSGLYTGDASNRVGIAGNNVSGQMAANNLQAQGQAQGARNLFNGAMSLATLAAGAPIGSGSSGLNMLGLNPSRISTFGYNPLSGTFSYGAQR